MKVGIWLPISPLSDWKYEGLVRLLGFMLSGINSDQQDTYRLMIPYWVKSEDIEEFLSKFSMEQRKKISFRRFEKANILLQLAVVAVERQKEARQRVKSGSGRIASLLRKAKRGIGSTLLSLVGMVRWSFFGVLMLILLSAGALVAMVVGIVFLVPLYIAYILTRFLMKTLLGGRDVSVRSTGSALVKRIGALFSPINFVRSLTEKELAKFASNAGKKSKVDCWYIPHMGYKSGVHLKGPKVFLFADFVFRDAPTGFSSQAISSAREMFANVLVHADSVIAISNHVAERHIQGIFNYPLDKIQVIPHGYVDISGQLDFLSRSNLTDNQGLAFVEKNSASKKMASGMIANSLDSMQRKNLNNVGPIYRRQLDYIKKMDFSKTEYVLVSTQNRPYKNTLGAIKALERYNLNADRPLKLIMTGDYGIDDTHSPVGSYVRKNGLYFDVLAIPRVPDDVHAALYHCATLALAASFFEGGTGSFVFDEAVSVGTPALLSHNLSHDEGLQGYKAYSTFTFNPNDPQKLAELIKSTLSQPEGNLYKTQWDIASNRMQKRSWEIVQKEYLEAFNQTINIRKPG